MLEQIIACLEKMIAALDANTAALNQCRTLTTNSGPTVVATVDASATPAPVATEEPKKTRKPKADKATAPVETAAPVADTKQEVATPPPAPTVKPEDALQEVRDLGQKLLDLTGDSSVIREYVKKVLPNEAKPALRYLAPEQLPAAKDFLLGEIAKHQKAA
jgi:hypothetical protein